MAAVSFTKMAIGSGGTTEPCTTMLRILELLVTLPIWPREVDGRLAKLFEQGSEDVLK